ncbi:MAG: CYTH domain-containing protein [Clostridia bacterium]|nr:CYTH domain-containing protein [Clostridia bacterium]
MELEMKYSIPSKEVADALWSDDFLMEIGDTATRKKMVMKAVYFDTQDGVLSKNNIAFRVRSEDGFMLATLKWGGTVENGFHSREEINVPVSGAGCFITSAKDIFKESEDGQKLLELLGDQPLVNLLETRFLRSCMRLSYGASIMEMAIDTGSIITDKGELPIMELELELYAGDPADVKALGEKLEERFGLVPGNESKLKRGLDLIRS